MAVNVRGSRSLAAEDVIFLIRKDTVTLARLKEFFSWKDLRKNSRPGDEGGLGIAGGGEGDEDILGLASNLEGIGASSEASLSRPPVKGPRRKQAKLPWDLLAGYVIEATQGAVDILEDEPADPEAVADTSRRLHFADHLTREMTREEYMEYSECRQASFTFKKAKKFRDWLNPAQYIDLKLNDDVIEILGFMGWEMVRRVTEAALSVKAEGRGRGRERVRGSESESGSGIGSERKRIREEESDGEMEECNLFQSPREKTAILPEHVQRGLFRLDTQRVNPAKSILPSHAYRRTFRLF